MNIYVNRRGKPDAGIVFQRGLMQFWVPSTMQSHLPYNPRHVPAVIFDVYWFNDVRGTYVHIWERTRSHDFDYNRRVFASYGGNVQGRSI